jgi:hypothetical protein
VKTRATTTRQAGAALGTTGGEPWLGRDEGAGWVNIARHLPEVQAVEAAEPALSGG